MLFVIIVLLLIKVKKKQCTVYSLEPVESLKPEHKGIILLLVYS